jgi:hypothetical protein
LNIYAQIYDVNGAFRVYQIPDTIIVQPDLTSLSQIVDGLISKNPSYETNKILNGGSYLSSLQEIQVISSLLNEQSLNDMKGLIESLNNRNIPPTFPQIYGPLYNYDGVLPVIINTCFNKTLLKELHKFYQIKRIQISPVNICIGKVVIKDHKQEML